MNIRKVTIRGMRWSTIGTVGKALFQLFQISILARFLDKEAFGLVAMATFIVNFTDIFVDMGFSTAIMHKQKSTRKEYSSIYWLNIGISFFLYCVIVFLTPFISNFYNESELLKILPLIGINLLLMAIGRQHRTIMLKNFKFKAIAITEIFSYFMGLSLAILLAINNWGIYSLIYSTLFSSFILNGLFLLQNLNSNPIFFHFKAQEIRPFFKVGIYNMGSSLLDFFAREIDILIIGKLLGAENLGIYSLAKQVSMKIYSIVTPIIFNVFNPILSSIQRETEKIKNYYLRITKYLTITILPIYLYVIFLSKEIMIILYGVEYSSGYIILSLLSISYATFTIIKPAGSLQIATGRTDIGFIWTIFRVTITPIFIFIAAHKSINNVAMATALISIVLIFLLWPIQLKKMINIKFSEFVKQFIILYIIFLLSTGLFIYTSSRIELSSNLVINILIKTLVTTFIMTIFFLSFEKDKINRIYRMIFQKK